MIDIFFLPLAPDAHTFPRAKIISVQDAILADALMEILKASGIECGGVGQPGAVARSHNYWRVGMQHGIGKPLVNPPLRTSCRFSAQGRETKGNYILDSQ